MTRVFGALHVKARFLCVIRNPYDTITTMSLKDGVCLEDATAQYMRLWEATALARKAVPPEVWLDIRHESLVSDVRATLQSVLQFVGLTADEEYLECCTKLVFPRVRQTRETGNWPTRLIDQVSRWLERYPQFSSYSF